ncbi:methylenetetrahydrofolate--tRNA-(uracil(54)-C(5))-methyltransferase (FADH(2)-oxidizing) TrmFO [Clostridium thermosuccinogenes]|uniref:Methylenetetrahydrofolate--tRNA-(uracil-5-)-methyltransferase TrmFO n=1 Tax=Clostridium thermosuccinogenes TaxID=84032 RepID=A0A2K2FPC7_9CLOT|nr:methylenetetrahydrofolate--tRNA-(uracil(54)-C(5))-methyltransferase (FADH(2)-oxidizing) TrmFO [Pseudoclostridium thermosuccinogenes]AUS96320.1 methylenetetrahydrofolate--tRNA-(uracil(54)-C(5))-methyltransferase (FADH(2)-oxidizing) TrmFO [Pseudoclostridium thermosuccinogenes]PNT98534.1 methylenetetrahydrofolate--tRNA-(uracil(54)-C(5))-methyltransferase (FADH(2)-oxidizing) TrmFO [Pseudoclostridium thermosuccinogenes]PNU00636.1 methylenetetrahydrofolate--tRNA-(uracil(54)-C(5))-methyltransferase 
MDNRVKVIGAGLAGCEAAWQLAKRGIKVELYEMKPKVFSPAHHLDTFAELVCSNSLRSDQLENAVGLLKEEMRRLDSIIMKCADATRVPAGGALAVDREKFSQMVTDFIRGHENITIINQEVEEIPEEGITIIASGPLTSDSLSRSLSDITGEEYLHFFDAAAPIVTYDSIDMTKAFRAARYNRGTDDYINCPMTKEQYEIFWNELVNAQTAEVKDFENEEVFEGCMPVETMAKRGKDTLTFGPLKPVGLIDPSTGREPYAVVQLRQDNREGTLYNIVGFQTHLKWPEQKRVFGLIPGLEKAEFVRYGVMHRNTFINSPKLLKPTYCMRKNCNIYFAGQITGVEGYVESASSGLVAGINAAMKCLGREEIIFPSSTAIGALSNYISDASIKNFQPMNVNFGLMEKLDIKIKDKREKNRKISERALNVIDEIISKERLL